ncbi:MAG: glycoside hydrolase family 65 protein [Bacteroidales bacterium]
MRHLRSYYKIDEWNIIEEGFSAEEHEKSESIFSIGNGRFGQRANFEEKFSGQTLQGSYVAGIYYPDKTRVGWWKNGYPEYFAKVLNAPNWIGINVFVEGEELDLAHCKVSNFRRVLNMKEGYLERIFIAELDSGKIIKVHAKRFISMANPELAAIKYSITPLNFNGIISFVPFIDADVKNEDANYNEKFWTGIEQKSGIREGYIISETKKTAFQVCTAMKYNITQDHISLDFKSEIIEKEMYVANKVDVNCLQEQETVLYKYIAVISSENHKTNELAETALELVNVAASTGFEILLNAHIRVWEEKWKESDIIIEGDRAAQQGIRFNIFHLNQTYTGDDERLNIGPKGFTGEKYGGSTYWDTEAYCVPFFLSTAPARVAKNLLIYRYKHLPKAIENARKLGFKGNAALYPMVTMNGEECHNEWEITFEEIHRNGAIAYAIMNYVNYTGDKQYLAEYGLEVLMGISRFWAQRVTFSHDKNKYVMLGVTGPNEYENNVNNNWYTNYIARWTLKYTLETIDYVKANNRARYMEIIKKWDFNESAETKNWSDIIQNLYLPENKSLGIFLQQDGYMDKEQILAKDLDQSHRPLNQNWSWDRILRSVFIKQADVLQGLFFFEQDFDTETIARNFDFYEPRTVHESSLSPCIHSIIASKIGKHDKAYEMYLRTSRLDLDDYNHEADEGLHITSMAGTWMSVIYGFAGMRVIDGLLHFSPNLPASWQKFSFKIEFRNSLLEVTINGKGTEISNMTGPKTDVVVNGHRHTVEEGSTILVN